MSKLAAWYPLHKDTNDWSGNGKHLTEQRPVSGHALTVDNGVIGRCYKSATIANTANLSTDYFKLGGDHAMFCFLNVTELANTTTANGVISNHRHDINTGTGITLRPTSASQFNLSVNTGHGTGRTYNAYCGKTALSINKWYHVGFTWEQSTRTLKLYVDGKEDFVSAGVMPEMAYSNRAALSLFAWSVVYLGTATYRPAQKIQDVRIYQGVPSLKEISEISKLCFLNWNFNQPESSYVRDSSGFGNDGIKPSNAPLYKTVESNLGHGCYYFDNDAIYSKEVMAFGAGGQITMATFIKTSVTGHGDYHMPLNISGASCEMSITPTGQLRSGLTVSGARQVFNSGGGLLDGKWHHIAMTYDGTNIKSYIDGELVGTHPRAGSMIITANQVRVGQFNQPNDQYASRQLYQSNAQIFGRALNEEDVKLLARQRLTVSKDRTFTAHELVEEIGNTRVSSRGQLVAPKLLENNFKPSLVDYSRWSIGNYSAPNFDINGKTTENLITVDSNPHGMSDVVWQTAKVDTQANADGGFNSTNFNIDKDKTYRFSIWINRKVMGNGTWYLGCYAQDAAGKADAIEDFSGVKSTNPYFNYGVPYGENQWFLVVGYVYAAGTTVAFTDAGVYLPDGTKRSDHSNPYRWTDDAKTARIRSYLFYSSNLETVQNFYRPRVDLMDGSQPSIAELTKCQEHTPLKPFYGANGAYIKHEHLSFTKNIIAKEFKEF